MKNRRINYLAILVFLMMFTACLPMETVEPQIGTLPTDPLPADAMQRTAVSSPKSEGPRLLLQTDITTYKILDPQTLKFFDFQFPFNDLPSGISFNISPAGSEFLLPINEKEVAIYEFKSGEVETTYQLQDEPSSFQPALAAQAARQYLPDLLLSEEELIRAVENASQQSRSKINWYNSGQAFFFIREDSDKDNHLYLFDRQKGEGEKIERMPALVENYWVGPDGNLLLLKKGYVFDPRTWQDDRYYLLDLDAGTTTPLILPEDVDNPTISWFTAEWIGITHQIEPVGGYGFSLFDVTTMETIPVIQESFTGIYPFGNELLILQHDREDNATLFTLQKPNGVVVADREVIGQCFFRAQVDPQNLLFACEEESILLSHQGLTIQPFGKPITLFSRSPNPTVFLVITKDGDVILYQETLERFITIDLEGNPSEILWMPDGAGFLYRTSTRLFYYDLQKGSSQFLISSDLFGDYRNLNATWIVSD